MGASALAYYYAEAPEAAVVTEGLAWLWLDMVPVIIESKLTVTY